MSEKDFNGNSYWLDKKHDLQITEHLSKHGNKLEVCSFVEKCKTKAQEKEKMKNSLKNLTATKEYSYISMFSKI